MLINALSQTWTWTHHHVIEEDTELLTLLFKHIPCLGHLVALSGSVSSTVEGPTWQDGMI
jgi:hypothetical protein